ncbi:3'-5' exonuclease [Flavobacterium sp. SUN052]|uniref:3'-5' exonuclease n=1 Tax=Flavobacterium sp. SUN052 TaxID=3002441 RepID=UPI00237D94B1|nr:3'-5' exonuclease [Flavobacterium sp. SUN052]MEC4005091.1 3'-5' exonuclease [Flavobacterium sp. SUN052]
MLDWLKNINKEHPEFWKTYLSKFDKKPSRYIALSVETTGLNPKKDVILSFGAIGVVNNNILIGDVFEVTIPQYKFLHDNGLSNDFLLESEQPKLSEVQAIEKLIEFIGNSTLVGHRINFDVEMINEALEKLACGRLKNEALDIEVMYKKLHDINDKNFSLDELSHIFKISKTERISTTDDAYTIALLFLKLKSRLGL